MQPQQFVAYYRVSTQKQGQSGLGLEAQRTQIIQHMRSEPTAEFTEVESGKVNDRPQLDAAIALAKLHRIPLVIAKLDRLSRDVEFGAKMLKSQVDIIVCDLPGANKFTLHVMMAIAEEERDMISKRTKAALQAAKARGVKLGGAQESTRKRVDAFVGQVLPHIQEIKDSGVWSFSGIADALNERGITTARGNQWTAMQAKRVMEKN